MDGRAEPFEHRRNENGQATEYIRWGFMRTKMEWREEAVGCVCGDEGDELGRPLGEERGLGTGGRGII